MSRLREAAFDKESLEDSNFNEEADRDQHADDDEEYESEDDDYVDDSKGKGQVFKKKETNWKTTHPE